MVSSVCGCGDFGQFHQGVETKDCQVVYMQRAGLSYCCPYLDRVGFFLGTCADLQVLNEVHGSFVGLRVVVLYYK